MQLDKRTNVMSTYGYTRVSTGRQADEGQSLGTQQRTLTGYAMMHGLEVTQTYVEAGVSGSVPLEDRPQGAALLAVLRKGDTVITPKLDRMFRSASDALNVLEDLKRRGISLHMIDLGGDVTGNGISKLVFTILSAVAESERDRIRERISTVKADQKARQRYLGGIVPYGMQVSPDGALVPDPECTAVIEAAQSMRRQGEPLRAIQSTLEAMGTHLSLGAISRIAAA